MDSVPIAQNKEMVHFRKINIFGYSGVGKSSFIDWLDSYKKKDFQIKKEIENSLLDSFKVSKNLVEQVKKVIVPINEDNDIHFLLYETILNHFDTIKANLDTLLVQTECIIIMWDKSHSNSFEKIPDLVNIIISMIKEHTIGTIDIFIVQSKSDLEFDISGEGQSENEIKQKIAELKNKYNNIINTSISLVNQDGGLDLLLDIVRKYNPANFDKNDVVNLVKIKYPMKSINNDENKKTVNICLVGNPKTGKSTFLKKLLEENEYNKIKREKIEPEYAILISNEKILVKISEVQGNNINYYRSSHGFLLFFDVTQKDSLKSLEEWANLIKEEGNGDIIIVGNKIDDREKRQIKKGEVKLFANKEKCKYFECSSLDGINVLEIFNEIVFDAYQIFMEFNSSRLSFALQKEENRIEEKIIIKKNSKRCFC